MHRRAFIAGMAGAAVCPLTGRAQPGGMPVIGLLNSQAAGSAMTTRMAGFLKGLSEQHYADGENVTIDYRWAEGHYDRLRPLADELVRRKVAVLVAPSQDAAIAAKAASDTIPIVFNVGSDPVNVRLVASMNHTGGNATGISMFTVELAAKRLGLLHEMLPKVTTVGVLINPGKADAANQSKEFQDAARALGLQILVRNVSSDRDFDQAFESLVHAGAQAMTVGADPFFSVRRDRLVGLAAQHRLPAMWEWPDFVEGGGLMSYGTSIVDAYRQVGVYTGKVLKGEKPADLPVMQAVQFELAINLKTAKALGLDVPATLLARVDEVIE